MLQGLLAGLAVVVAILGAGILASAEFVTHQAVGLQLMTIAAVLFGSAAIVEMLERIRRQLASGAGAAAAPVRKPMTPEERKRALVQVGVMVAVGAVIVCGLLLWDHLSESSDHGDGHPAAVEAPTGPEQPPAPTGNAWLDDQNRRHFGGGAVPDVGIPTAEIADPAPAPAAAPAPKKPAVKARRHRAADDGRDVEPNDPDLFAIP